MDSKLAAHSLDPLDVNFRLLEAQDLPALEWDGEFSHFRRMYREIFNSTQHGKSLMWVAELSGEGIIGQVFIQLRSSRLELANGIDRAYIYSFRIKPAFRNRGIGSNLLNTVEKDLLEKNYQWATLNVARDNLLAYRFYVRNGYRKIAAEAGHWTYQDDAGRIHQVHEPAWRMQKRLLSG